MPWPFYKKWYRPPTYPLRPITKNNTGLPRLAATAGTRLVEAYLFARSRPYKLKGFKRQMPFITSPTYCNWIEPFSPIVQDSSLLLSYRKSGRFSVPLWLVILSNQLEMRLGGPLPHQLPVHKSSFSNVSFFPCITQVFILCLLRFSAIYRFVHTLL